MEKQSRKRLVCDICNLTYVRAALYPHRKTHFAAQNMSLLNLSTATSTTNHEQVNESNTSPEEPIEESHFIISPPQSEVSENEEYISSSSDEYHTSDDSADDDSDNLSTVECDPFNVEEQIADNVISDNESSSDTVTSSDDDDDTDHEKFSSLLSRFLLLWQSSNKITNTAMEPMLKFVKILLQLVGNVTVDIKSYKQLLKKNEHSFVKYIVCPHRNCHTLYDPNLPLFKVIEGRKEPVKCTHVSYPRHPYAHHRRPCGEQLSEEVKNNNGMSVFRAKKIYCYRRVKDSVVKLVRRTGFEEACTHWTTRDVHENILSDIYDGRVWKEFQEQGYIQSGNDFALMLNVDFFQPFKHVKYSVGVIFLCILNLPREERYKRGNIILVGLIPGPKEPKSLNNYLEPMVDELLESFNNNGFNIKSHLSPEAPLKFRLFLICVACDIPAVRTTCGFLGHAARLGCSKCKKEFPGSVGDKDYSGFDRHKWTPRTREQHREQVRKICRRGITRKEKTKLESKYGVRYTVLSELPYHDPVKHHAICLMHGIFTGSGKKLNTDWVAVKTIKKPACREMQEIMNAFIVPSEVGRIPHKIGSGFSGFTADQWKNWIITFSMFVLYDRVPPQQLECWRLLVRACCILCNKYLSVDDVNEADKLLLQFCVACERVYNYDYITPNMHMHGHVKDTILDYGPVYVFWLFAFERFNGILEQQKTNKRNIEQQLMKKFLQEIAEYGGDANAMPENALMNDNEELRKLFDEIKNKCNSNRGTLLLQNQTDMVKVMRMAEQNYPVTDTLWWLTIDSYQWKKPKITFLSNLDREYLRGMYSYLYNTHEINVARSTLKVNRLKTNNAVIGCKDTGSCRSSYILAHWCGMDDPQLIVPKTELRPGVVRNLYIHNVKINGEHRKHIIAKVEWFSLVPQILREKYGEPIKVFSTLTEVPGISTFIPVQRLFSKFACTYQNIVGRDVIVVCPLSRNL